MGLPTAPCGDDFDIDLDDKIGYYANLTDIDFDEIAPGLSAKKRAVEKRAFARLGNAISSFGRNVKSGAEKLGNGVKQGATKLVDGAKAGVKEFTKVASNILPGGSSKYDKTVSVSLKPKEQVDSVFGTANSYLLYNASTQTKDGHGSAAVQLYCVDCGVEGSASIHGELAYTYAPPLPTEFIVGVQGSIAASAYLGLHAEAAYKRSYKKTLMSFPVPNAAIKVGNLVTIGAVLQLDAQADLELKARGQLLVGASVAIEDFSATMDLFGDTSRVTPLDPKITRKFNASGQISAEVGLGLPMELAVGLSIPKAKVDKKVGLRSTALVTGRVDFKASSDLEDTKDCNNGLSWAIGVSESLDADLVGTYKNLAKFERPDLFSGCYQLPVSSGGGKGEGNAGTGGGSTATPPKGGDTPSSGIDDGQGPDDEQGGGLGSGGSQGDDGNGGQDEGDEEGDGGDNGDGGDSGDNTEEEGDGNDDARRRRSTQRRRSINLAKRKIIWRQDATANDTTAADTDHDDDTADVVDSTAEAETTGQVDTTGEIGSNSTQASSSTNTTTMSTDGSSDDAGDHNDEGSFDDIDSAFGWSNRTDDLTAEDISYISLLDSTGGYCMANDDDGNFFLLPASESKDWTYASYDGKVVAGDGYDYYFFYYPDEMETLGVSRFRMNDDDHFPQTADMISLAPINYDSDSTTPGVYVALDSQLNAYYPMLCQIEDLGDKVFLVKDLETGAATLQDPNLQPVITGGLTTACVPLALFSDFAGY